MAITRRDLLLTGTAAAALPAFGSVAGVSFVGTQYRQNEAAVREGQRRVCDGKLTLRGPVTDDLHGDTRTADGVHFSDKGLKEHARVWADVLMKTVFAKK